MGFSHSKFNNVPRLSIASQYEALLKEVKVPGLALLDPGGGRGAGPEIGMDNGTYPASFWLWLRLLAPRLWRGGNQKY